MLSLQYISNPLDSNIKMLSSEISSKYKDVSYFVRWAGTIPLCGIFLYLNMSELDSGGEGGQDRSDTV